MINLVLNPEGKDGAGWGEPAGSTLISPIMRC